MKTTTTTVLLALILTSCSSSCAGSSSSSPTVNWPRVVTCTEPALAGLLESVQRILVEPEPAGVSSSIGDGAIRKLTDMAAAHGEHVVACLIDEAVRSFEDATRSAAAAPKASPASPDVPAERKSLRTAPTPQGPEPPVSTVPTSDGTAELYAAARGRDFLARVARTRVQADDRAHGAEP